MLMVSALMVTGLAGAARMTEAGGETVSTDSSPHVRSSNPAIRGLIVRATEQSATFRRMVETINASDSVVYVERSMGTSGAFETAAAVKAGDAVLAEVKAFRRARGY